MSLILFLTLLFHADGGTPLPRVNASDREVVQNLELLELMEETTDFDLLEELSVER